MKITKNAVLNRTIPLVAGVLLCGALAVNASAEIFDSSPKSVSLSYSGSQPEYLSKNSLKAIFQKDSYWKMTQYSYGPDAEIRGEYNVKLFGEVFPDVQIVSAEGDDLRTEKGAWLYNDATGTLEISVLDDGYANHIFHYQNGIFVCEGTYYRTELVHTSGAEREFNNALKSFVENYGGYNPAKRLVTTNDHFRYVDVSELDTLPYDTFRHLVNNKSYGLIVPADDSRVQELNRAYASLLGKNMSTTFKSLSVLLGVNVPEQESRYWRYSGSVDITNLIYKDYDEVSNAFMTLAMAGENLLNSGAISQEMTAPDIYQGAYFWNNTEAVAIVQYGGSLLIFQGPTSEIKTMTGYLGLAPYSWEKELYNLN